MTFNTGNPIGSTDARDLSDNAENFDKALGTLDATWTDRLGVTRDSFEGRLAKGSFYRVGDFTTGYTLTNMRQTLEYSGHEYSWAGTFPKVVAAGATPATSGGIGAGAWVDRTDVTLRDEIRETVFQNMKRLAAEAGFNLVDGSFEEGAVISGWPDVVWSQTDGKYYQWYLDEAKTIAAGSTPATSGGVGAGAWVDRTDATLRSEVDKTRFATISKLINLDSYSGVIDPTMLIGKVVSTDYHNTAADNTSPGGGARYLIQTAAQYGGTPDGSTVNSLPAGGDHYIGGGTSYVAKLLGDSNNEFDIEMFGAYQGQAVTYSTQAVNSAISYANGRKLYWPAKRIRYEGVSTVKAMCIVGRQRPRVADDKSALQNGSTLVGWCLWRPVWGCFVDIGVDHGSANFSTAADGLKISATGPTVGKWCIVHGCIGLGRDPEDATHAILVEGYAHAEITQVYGCRNYFGLAVKILDGLVNGVTAVDNGLYGVILKSDATYGGFRDVNVSNIDIVGTPGNTGIGLEIETVESTQMQRLNIVNVNARNVETALRINAASGVINDINISNVIGQNCSEDAVIQLGTVYNLVMTNIQAIACAKRAMNIAGSRFLSIDGFIAKANSGNTYYATDFVLIQSLAVRTMIDRLNLVDSSYTSGGFGTIKYDNVLGQNQLGMYNAVKTGVGAPD